MSIQAKAPPRRSPWQRASSDTSCPCAPPGRKTAKSSTPNSTASCGLHPSPEGSDRSTQPHLPNHFKHRIPLTGQSVAGCGRRAPRPENPSFLRRRGNEFGRSGRIGRIARHAAIRRQSQTGRGPIRSRRFRISTQTRIGSQGKPSNRYPRRCLQEVFPRRCSRQAEADQSRSRDAIVHPAHKPGGIRQPDP